MTVLELGAAIAEVESRLPDGFDVWHYEQNSGQWSAVAMSHPERRECDMGQTHFAEPPKFLRGEGPTMLAAIHDLLAKLP